MKKLILILVALGLIVWGAWTHYQNKVSPTASSTVETQVATSTVKTYQDPEGRFSFIYPNHFTVTGEENASTSPTGWSNFSAEPGRVLARIKVPREYAPQTNFSEAWFTVGWSNSAKAIRSCIQNPGNGVNISDATIDGISYKKLNSTDAAAGNLYETTAYRAILDGDCYSLEYTIHSTNIGNYDPNMGIKEFDKAKIQNELDSIAKSFHFLVNSD